VVCGQGIDNSDPVAIGVDVIIALADVRVREVGLEITVGELTTGASAGARTLVVARIGTIRLFVADG
jgi:hypothetical protein